MSLNRREFIQLSGGCAALSLLPQVAFSKAKTSSKTFVAIFLRGGMDGLSLFVPYQEKKYYDYRKQTAIQKPGTTNGCLKLDGNFGLNPRAKALENILKNNAMSVLQAVGYDQNSRSHFKEQDIWETGTLKDYIRSDGWMNRYLSTTKGDGVVRGLSMSDNLPRILRGESQTISIRSLKDLMIGKDDSVASASLRGAYGTEDKSLVTKAGENMLKGMKDLGELLKGQAETKIKYPQGALGTRLKDVAKMIKAKIGLEMVEIDVPGWDTHRGQGSINGAFGNNVEGLSESLWAFYQDLEKQMDDVSVLVFSEFGRTAKENGTGGTDHGWGNCMLTMGSTIPKKKKSDGYFFGEWPGLNEDQLNQKRDLKNKIDFRDVFGEILTKHLNYKTPELLFKDHKFKPLNFL
ncbi:MAG: hypothetical protein COA79_09050 [Planctomycetota bacterium]|nr:MAG: hypothetical protein COA79_09050 [Planctomycetota bacterium]